MRRGLRGTDNVCVNASLRRMLPTTARAGGVGYARDTADASFLWTRRTASGGAVVMWDEASLARLNDALATYDNAVVEECCDELVEHLLSSGKVWSAKRAKAVLQGLRRKRHFAAMARVADALVQSGQRSAAVQRQLGQALIELGHLGAAIAVLERVLVEHPGDLAEVAEVKGLLGRAHKQRFINASRTFSSPEDRPGAATALLRRSLNDAIEAYWGVYGVDDTTRRKSLWHGINVVALVMRGERDGLDSDVAIDAKREAEKILCILREREMPRCAYWDLATGAEVCVGLGRLDEALTWIKPYVLHGQVDEFELNSTLRQLTEVWGLSEGGEGDGIVSVLHAALLERAGGRITVSPRNPGVVARTDIGNKALEQVFGEARPTTLRSYALGIDRALAVARIQHRDGLPAGSGFLVRAADFFEAAKPDELLLLTNSHVLGDIRPRTLRIRNARVYFEGLENPFETTATEVVWESPVGELDATLVRLSEAPKNVKPCPVGSPEALTLDGRRRRLYVIGHPLGGALSLSIEDNLQVGWAPPFVHYRTPTEPGSSGSPVFDDEWTLVALHHASVRLNPSSATHDANEGVWIHEIIAKIRDGASLPRA